MLFKITRGGVPSFKGNPEEFVYLLSSLDTVQAAGLPYAFTDSHPLTRPYNFYDDPEHLGKVDWTVMRAQLWSSEEDPGMMAGRVPGSSAVPLGSSGAACDQDPRSCEEGHGVVREPSGREAGRSLGQAGLVLLGSNHGSDCYREPA